MRTLELAAMTHHVTLSIIAAVVIAGGLVLLVVHGVRHPRRPPPSDVRPTAWTAHDDSIRAAREPNEMPHVEHNAQRLLPHELAGYGTLSTRARTPDQPATPESPQAGAETAGGTTDKPKATPDKPSGDAPGE